MGIEPDATTGAILLVYFVQGALGIARLATTFFLKDELGLGPAESAALLGITTIPWVIKPLYGFLSDSVPLLGYRRRSYLGIAGLISCAAYLSLGLGVETPTQACVALTVGSLGVAVSDVVVDSLVVEKTRDGAVGSGETATASRRAGALQSLCWGSSAVGSVLSAYASGALLSVVPPRAVFEGAALFPLLAALTALAINEAPVRAPGDPSNALEEGTGPGADWAAEARGRASLLWGAIRERRVLLPTLFLFAWKATPSANQAFFYYLTGPELGFDAEFLGRASLAGALASLAGVVAFQRFLADVPASRVLKWTTLAGLPFGLLQLALVTHANRAFGVPDQLFALGASPPQPAQRQRLGRPALF